MVTFLGTVEPRYNEGPSDWQNLFAISRFFFTYFTITGVKKIVLILRVSLHRGSLYQGSTVLARFGIELSGKEDRIAFVVKGSIKEIGQ